MDYEQLVKQLDPEMVKNFRRAIEVGKWPDGNPVSKEQKEHCMAAVLAYEQKFVDEKERVGYIDRGSKSDGEMCDDEPQESKPLKWS